MSLTKSKALFAAWISLLSNIFLTVGKITVGLGFKSPSLLADGIHNAADVLASGASLFSMKISQQPPDDDHPYGHGKAEVIASALVAIILVFASFYMIIESCKTFFSPAPEIHLLPFLAGLLSLIWKQWLYLYTIRIGRQENSKGLIATAYDHLSDVYASIAVVVGIGCALLAQLIDISQLSFLLYGDSLAGIIVSVIILKMSYQMGKESIDILMDKNVAEEIIQQYEKRILQIPQVKRIDSIRAREHGSYILIDIRVSVPSYLSVQKGHDIALQIQTELMNDFPNVKEVFVHINPWVDQHKKNLDKK
ncbi:cation diffusion facilitator family transporter [Seinonella peptonophila]|uniref:Cation diffusion facilitator family transporter n=1 Tax=Seinonella peptonophila TaxID=112248 RepID=A0A1M4X038_9BACL|nr:cation diffusion facilitator family transporter [Seinonella peptonophila]SHE86876.1 cation diffusion facilitator family transporter [Seinonella peptonophila]